MNKYIRNMIVICLIVFMFLIFVEYWVGAGFGVWHIFLVIAGVYGVWANFNALKKSSTASV